MQAGRPWLLIKDKLETGQADGLSCFFCLWLNTDMENRMRELDGLRGLAIILVMTGHIAKRAMFFSKHDVLRYITDLTFIGWVGVDIFFALSGFLITSILLRTRQDE